MPLKLVSQELLIAFMGCANSDAEKTLNEEDICLGCIKRQTFKLNGWGQVR
jgi:hypothetical protein